MSFHACRLRRFFRLFLENRKLIFFLNVQFSQIILGFKYNLRFFILQQQMQLMLQQQQRQRAMQLHQQQQQQQGGQFGNQPQYHSGDQQQTGGTFMRGPPPYN